MIFFLMIQAEEDSALLYTHLPLLIGQGEEDTHQLALLDQRARFPG